MQQQGIALAPPHIEEQIAADVFAQNAPAVKHVFVIAVMRRNAVRETGAAIGHFRFPQRMKRRRLRDAVNQDQCGMKVGTDGVLLGAWARGEGVHFCSLLCCWDE